MPRPLAHVVLVLLCLTLAVPAADAVVAPEERLESTPTGWWWLYGVTAQQITDLIDSEGARLIDLEIQSSDPLLFSAAFVRNSGVHASGWWWYFNIPFGDIAVYLDQNQARLIDIERSADGLYTVIMVPNTGDQAKTWWYYGGRTLSQLQTEIDANGARLVDIESYPVRDITVYDAIMIANTGDDASGWYWWLGADPSFLANHVEETGYRIVDLDVVGSGDEGPVFNAITVPPTSNWWWYYGLTAAQVSAVVDQTGSRIVDIEPYVTGAGTRFAIALTNNSNALTTEIAGLLGYGDDGSTGFLLREIGGPTLASLQPDFRFEPASSIKIFHHFHAMRLIANGLEDPLAPLLYSINYSGSCPIGGSPFDTASLQLALRRMMVESDNAATEAIRDRYGEAAIMSSVQIFGGVQDSGLNHAPLGCGTQAVANPNEMTLRDAGSLYEEIATGPTVAAVREDMYRWMQSHLTTPSDQWWLTTQVRQMVVDEATSLGIPDDASGFWDSMEIAWKPGGYGLNGLNYVSVAGTIAIPECLRGTQVLNDYVFGLFLHGSVDTQRLFDVTQEMFRDLIRAGLESCDTATDAPPVVALAGGLELEPASPNPFNPRTEIRFALTEAGPVRVSVIDPRGRELAVLTDEHRAAGSHALVWNGTDRGGSSVGSGVYYVRAEGAGVVKMQKVTLLK